MFGDFGWSARVFACTAMLAFIGASGVAFAQDAPDPKTGESMEEVQPQPVTPQTPVATGPHALTAGALSNLNSENYQLDLMIENIKKKNTLAALKSGGLVNDGSMDTQGQQDRRLPAEIDAATNADPSPPEPKAQESTNLPLVTKVSGSNGILHVDLIYRNGETVPQASAGTILPTGEKIISISTNQVVIQTPKGQKRLPFLSRRYSQ